jgi:hypothetical protein
LPLRPARVYARDEYRAVLEGVRGSAREGDSGRKGLRTSVNLLTRVCIYLIMRAFRTASGTQTTFVNVRLEPADDGYCAGGINFER